MTSRVIPVSPFSLVVFGATGDLSRRKLLPAMFHRDLDGQLPDEAVIIGVARAHLDDAGFVAQARQAVIDHVPSTERDETVLARFLALNPEIFWSP